MRVDLAKWGNSAAVRIPKKLLDSLDLAIGDALDLTAEDGCICIMPIKSEHRKVKPARGISYSNLFSGYEAKHTSATWPNEDLVGAEERAWQ